MRSLLISSDVTFAKWPPDGHIGFFWFPDSSFSLTLIWLHITRGYGLKYTNFSDAAGKIAAWHPRCIFIWVSRLGGMVRSVILVCYDISISNFMYMMFVAMGRSLLIICSTTFKMATWQPYWIFLVPDSKFRLALNIKSKVHWHITPGTLLAYVGRILVILNDVQLQSTHCSLLPPPTGHPPLS